MAYLSKEAYERKREWAARRMEENAEIETLTEEQHEVLAWLCSIRHDVHCNQDDLWFSEASDHKKYWDYITKFSEDGEIAEKLSEVGLPVIQWSFDPEDYMTDGECYEFNYTEEEREEEHIRCLEMAGKFNEDVEKYLSEIDKEKGTNYCPDGATRIY